MAVRSASQKIDRLFIRAARLTCTNNNNPGAFWRGKIASNYVAHRNCDINTVVDMKTVEILGGD
jgi:hypothetical protein